MPGVLPQIFDVVQFRPVRRQEKQAHSLPGPAPATLLDGLAAMDTGIVEYHDVRQRPDLRTELVEESDPFLFARPISLRWPPRLEQTDHLLLASPARPVLDAVQAHASYCSACGCCRTLGCAWWIPVSCKVRRCASSSCRQAIMSPSSSVTHAAFDNEKRDTM